MTRAQFVTALHRLGLTHASMATARALGLSIRQVQRIAKGTCPVPETVANLLRLQIQHKGK